MYRSGNKADVSVNKIVTLTVSGQNEGGGGGNAALVSRVYTEIKIKTVYCSVWCANSIMKFTIVHF